MKRRVVLVIQKYVFNPPIQLSLRFGAAPPGYALLETIGRKSGKARPTPVGNGLVGDTFWIVTEHGRRAGYVRNIGANPRVRVKVRHGLRYVWREGTAQVLPDDDTRARQRWLGRGHPLRVVNAVAVRALSTELLTVRIDLDPLK